MVRERGLILDHTTVWRWVQRYAPEINKRIRPHLKMSGTSYRVDETYIKVGKTCKYHNPRCRQIRSNYLVYALCEARRSGSKTVLSEDDGSRSRAGFHSPSLSI